MAAAATLAYLSLTGRLSAGCIRDALVVSIRLSTMMLTIVIGAEHSSPDLRPFSLIASTALDGATMRTVGVIGPTRMAYERVIPIVDITAKLLSTALSHSGPAQQS